MYNEHQLIQASPQPDAALNKVQRCAGRWFVTWISWCWARIASKRDLKSGQISAIRARSKSTGHLSWPAWEAVQINYVASSFSSQKLRISINFLGARNARPSWSKDGGRMLACHAGGPGSIPGRCKLLARPKGSYWYRKNSRSFFRTNKNYTALNVKLYHSFQEFDGIWIWRPSLSPMAR